MEKIRDDETRVHILSPFQEDHGAFLESICRHRALFADYISLPFLFNGLQLPMLLFIVDPIADFNQFALNFGQMFPVVGTTSHLSIDALGFVWFLKTQGRKFGGFKWATFLYRYTYNVSQWRRQDTRNSIWQFNPGWKSFSVAWMLAPSTKLYSSKVLKDCSKIDFVLCEAPSLQSITALSQ